MISTGTLRQIECLVRLSYPRLRIWRIREWGVADTRGHRACIEQRCLANPRYHRFGYAVGVNIGCVVKQDPKLLTTKPECCIPCAEPTTQELAKVLQYLIPGGVTEVVVDALEMIQIDGQQRHRQVLARGPRHGVLEQRIERASVEKSGQRIVSKLTLQTLLLARNDVDEGIGKDTHADKRRHGSQRNICRCHQADQRHRGGQKNAVGDTSWLFGEEQHGDNAKCDATQYGALLNVVQHSEGATSGTDPIAIHSAACGRKSASIRTGSCAVGMGRPGSGR